MATTPAGPVIGGAAPLVSASELATYLQVGVWEDLDQPQKDAAELAARLVSGLVRSACDHQQISLVVDDVQVLRGGERVLVLPQRPVLAVSAVSAAAGLEVPATWSWDGLDRLTAIAGVWWPAVVTVTYSHGFDPVPDGIQSVALSAAARIFGNPAGVRSWSVDDVQRTFAGGDADVTAAGTLTAAERGQARAALGLAEWSWV